jgi:NDP-sugar pyrophosphorylase family protein
VSLPDAAILCGGLATRLGGLAKETPKALLPVAGRPFLHHQLKQVAGQGVRRVVLCTGHLTEQIEAFVGDGSAWGLVAKVSRDPKPPLGTGGALRQALPLLSDPFFVLYGDSWLEAPWAPALGAFEAARPQALALMTVVENAGRWDRSNVRFEAGRIVDYDKSASGPEYRHADYGLGLLAHAAFDGQAGDRFDLAELYRRLVLKGRLAGHDTGQRFWEIGSAAGLEETRARIAAARNQEV